MSWHADYFATFEIASSPTLELNPEHVAAALKKRLTGLTFDLGKTRGGRHKIKVINITFKKRKHGVRARKAVPRKAGPRKPRRKLRPR